MGALRQLASVELDLEMEVDSKLLCGIVIQVPGGEWQWNIAAYLGELEHTFLSDTSTPVASR